MDKQKLKTLREKIPSDRIGLLIALIVMIAVFSLFNKHFFSYKNMINILIAASLTGLVAVGETYLVIAGLVDLSAGSVAAFGSVLAAVVLSSTGNVFVTVVIVILAGILIGIFNAVTVNSLKLEPFIATLASMSIVRGLAYIICNGKPVFITNNSFLKLGSQRIFGIPVPVIILIISFIIFGVILSKTRFGRSIYVVGGNKEAARLAGLNPKRITLILYMVNGALAALGGALLAARMNSGQPAASVGLEFDAITAAVLGGTAFSGGVGTIFGTVLGVFILQGFNTGLIMLNVPTFWQYVARGLLLLIALTFDFLRKRRRDKKILESSMANS
ncbi:ABC transporter permease [Vallitalea maricola]|uniref:Arabinose ABC transporter permease AraH n=1 Tax=Vallitalea maricola TaxID=3074433 RepID=A0ACB5UFU6_9FIRM|nr:arabinose ABC transporter permease AraH [Vallitalea sp. AN17-2]